MGKAIAEFGIRLQQSAYNPGLAARLFNPKGLNERAMLLASLMQVTQVLLNDELAIEPTAMGQNNLPRICDTAIDKARKQYYELEKAYQKILLETGSFEAWALDLGRSEFKAVKQAMEAVEKALVELSKDRKWQKSAEAIMELKGKQVQDAMKISRAEMQTRAAQLQGEEDRKGREAAEESKKESDARAEQERKRREAAEKGKMESDARAEQERKEREAAENRTEQERQEKERAEQKVERMIKKALFKKVNKRLNILEELPSPELAEALHTFCTMVSADSSEPVEKVERLLHQVLSESFMLLEARLLQGTSMIARSSSVGSLRLFAAPPSKEETNSEQTPSVDKRT